ncbi:MAG: hypothetical protein F4Y60_01370, partial [Boseongicola sp. SB0664_bin_43]|nr:hypothetical protein [Boseongicola sp. SB0664_bin_43]
MADFAISPDGTRIAHETGGSGAPLILVHGASGDRTSTPALLASLEETHAVYTSTRPPAPPRER